MLVDIKDFDKEVSRLCGKDMIADARDVLKNLPHYPSVGDTVYTIDKKLKINKTTVYIISLYETDPPSVYTKNGHTGYFNVSIFMTREEAVERKNEIVKHGYRKGDAC